jgi:hypothetical protein
MSRLTSFQRAFLGALAVLVILVAGFAILSFAQGPKLSSAQVDTTAVVSEPDQSLRLAVNQSVSRVTTKQVSITPAASFTVSTTGQLISIQFVQPLKYATAYRVSVRGVASAVDSRSATLVYGFRTASPALYYLHRSGTSAPDQIIRTGIHSTATTVVYSAPRIQDFVVVDNALAVARISAQGLSSLAIVGAKGEVKPIRLPGEGSIDLLSSNRDTGVLGFTFTSAGPTPKRKYSNTLFTVNPTGKGVATAVKGLGGTPLSVLAWSFVPASSDLVAQNIDESIVLVDTTQANGVTPLGSYPELWTVSADAKSVVVADDLGPLAVSLSTGTAKRLVASRFDGTVSYSGDAPAISVPGGWLQVDPVYDETTGGFTSHLVFDNGTKARQLYQTPNPLGTIDNFSDSPNNQYVAIETTPDAPSSVADGYLVDGRSKSETSEFVDIASGALVKRVTGFDVSW